jgi:hypothetical protein
MASLIHDYETFEDHLFYSDTTEEEYIKQYVVVNSDLTGCKCCKRHTKNFPGDKVNSSECKEKQNCSCPCRHVARFIIAK